MSTLLSRRIQHKVTEWYYSYRTGCGLPAQLPSEVAFFKRALLSFSSSKLPLRIFEWGSGNSTLFYADFLKNQGRSFEWHAVENSAGWAEKVKEMVRQRGLESHVHIHLKTFSAFFEKKTFAWERAGEDGFGPTLGEENDYINFPSQLTGRFDVMIVDGRFRRRCLLAATTAVSPDGLVMLHDAERAHYHSSLPNYPHQFFFSSGKKAPGSALDARVWVGSPGNRELVAALSVAPR